MELVSVLKLLQIWRGLTVRAQHGGKKVFPDIAIPMVVYAFRYQHRDCA